jgi:hypothetical protein
MWSAIFAGLALACAALALMGPEAWNAFFWVAALVSLAALGLTASGAIGRHRSKDEPARTPPQAGRDSAG